MKDILITGNSGYIGSHLTKLLETKYNVYGLDLNWPQIKAKEHYIVDIKKHFIVHKEFDTVIHLAALVNVSESQKYPIKYYTTNLNGTLKVLQNTRYNNFIFASTGAAEYCESAYAISKRAAEDCVKSYCDKYTIFRFYNVIGSSGIKPTNLDGLFYNLLNTKESNKFTIFGTDYDTEDGTAIRDYVHVDEICNSIALAIDTPSNKTENLGHGTGYSVKQIVEKFKEVNKVDFKIELGDRRPGDLPISVLQYPSSYMQKTHSIEQLLSAI